MTDDAHAAARSKFAEDEVLPVLRDIAANLDHLMTTVAKGDGIGLGHPAFWAIRKADDLLCRYQNDVGRTADTQGASA